MSTELCIKLNKNEKIAKKHLARLSVLINYLIVFLYTLDIYHILPVCDYLFHIRSYVLRNVLLHLNLDNENQLFFHTHYKLRGND